MIRITRATPALLLAACAPGLEVDETRLTGPRILAVEARPAEAAPGEIVRLTAQVAEGDAAEVQWSVCVARKPLTEAGPVSPACVQAQADALLPAGQGASIELEVPRDACRLFGPDPPPAVEGQPPGRPVDPDFTGGYQLPIRLDGPGGFVFHGLRLTCGAAGASREEAAELRRRGHRNTPPSIETGPLAETRVAAGATVSLAVTWPACPSEDVCGDGLCGPDEDIAGCPADCTTPVGCGGAERYVLLDPETRDVTERTEVLRVAWLATGGAFAEPRTGGEATGSTNTWIAPTQPGSYRLWVVVRDERGAATARLTEIEVSAP